jgi:hypothetical protein
MDTQKFWYDEEDDNVAGALFKYVDYLLTMQDYRTELNRRHLRLYGNYDALGLADQSFTSLKPVDRLTLNVVAMNIDTAVARIAKNKPRPKFLTSGGSIPMERKAQKLEKFVDGVLYQNTAHAKMQAMFRSACVFGDGFVKVHGDIKKGKVIIEKRFTPNILVDEQDAMNGDPLCMYEIAIVNKHTVAQKYPKQAEAILSSARPATGFYADMYTDDQIVLIEAIKRASKDGEKDGRKVICCSNAKLEDVEYSRERFQYVKFGYQPKEIGFFSEGISEMLTSIQYELNKTLRTAQQAINLCVPKLMIRSDATVVMQHMNNEIGSAFRWSGERPEWTTLVGVPGDVKEHIENLYEKSFQRTGLSNLAAFGEKPANISSGKGLREYNDIETERFAVISQGYEQAYLDLWALTIDAAEELASQDKKFSVTALDKSMIEKIAWADIDMAKDSYVLQTFPASMLSKNPSGRYDDVTDMMDRGLLDKESATELLQFPDIEGYFIEANSPKKNIRTVIEMIVDKGIYYPPNEYQALEMGIKIMNNMLLYYTDRELEPERLELFGRWISDAQALLMPPVPPTEDEAMDAATELSIAQGEDVAAQAQAQEEAMLDEAGLQAAMEEEAMAEQAQQDPQLVTV